MYNVVNRISLMISSHSVTVIRALHQHCTLHSVGVIQTPGATFQPGLASNQTVDGIIKKKTISQITFLAELYSTPPEGSAQIQ